MKKIIFGLIVSVVFLVACSEKSEAPVIDEVKSIKVNGKTFAYDKALITAIDESERINKKQVPTVKTIQPDRDPQYKIVAYDGNERVAVFTLWDESNHYLINIEKENGHYWLSLEGGKYTSTKEALTAYQALETPYNLSIETVTNHLSNTFPILKIEPASGVFLINFINQEKQEKYCYEKEDECIYFYETTGEEETIRVKQSIEEKLKLMSFEFSPKIYTVKNVMMLYLPNSQENTLEKAILETIQLVQ